MRVSVGIFFGTFIGSYFLFTILTKFFSVDGGSNLEPFILSIGMVIILLLCYLISIIHYLIKQQQGVIDEESDITAFSVDNEKSSD
ncbi:hypothetical protein GH741_12605 [Aquibacillus halophilus]|uniref:Uncharacterized protein n=1 Tax=Aquibacillus halophilus TaxID=930132 RepID=A0A6A8DE52_9BACI|nr:hypothetical protein [Aquibacillus halophilus]MRH43520.1 hypothetical protein [Aquibacillus halophilus]